MKTRCSSIPQFLALVTLFSLIMCIGEKTGSEASQIENQKNLEIYSRSIQIAQEVLTQLGKGSLLNGDDAALAVGNGFTLLQKLIKDNNELAQELGFQIGHDKKAEDIIEDAKTLLDNAFPIFEIHLTDLLRFSPEADVKHILFFTNQLLFPINADKQQLPQSSLTIRFIPNKQGKLRQKQSGLSWRPTRWGQKNLITLLAKTQKDREVIQTAGFLVSIPSLNRDFFGYTDNTAIKFVPLFTDYLFTQGKSLSAEEALGKLSEEAMNVDGSPR